MITSASDRPCRFASGPETSPALNGSMLDQNFTWTDSSGKSRNKPEILEAVRSGKNLELESAGGIVTARSRTGGNYPGKQRKSLHLANLDQARLALAIIDLSGGFHRRSSFCRIGQGDLRKSVQHGAIPSAKTTDERDVIHAYQAVERAVTAHDSAAWGAHIADEFFAVTSNSDRPLDKTTRMEGLDNQKVAGNRAVSTGVGAHV